jgi:hypothetical protein
VSSKLLARMFYKLMVRMHGQHKLTLCQLCKQNPQENAWERLER